MAALGARIAHILCVYISTSHASHDPPDLAAQCDQDSAVACSAVSLLQTGLKVREHPGPELEVPDIAGEPDSASQPTQDVPGMTVSDLVDDMGLPDTYVDPSRSQFWDMYGLNAHAENPRTDGMFQLTTGDDGKCYMTVPLVTGTYPNTSREHISQRHYIFDETPQYKGFTFGECPTIFPLVSKKRLRHVGRNPALIAMPARLKAAFPDGRWLTIGSNPIGTLQLLNDGFETIEATQIRIVGGEEFEYPVEVYDWGGTRPTGQKNATFKDYFFQDPRLFLMNDDTIAMSLQPYSLQETKYAREGAGKGSWWDHEVFAVLSVSAQTRGGVTRLDASIERSKARYLEACPKEGVHNAFEGTAVTQKDIGFLQSPDSGDLYLLDYIYPARAGKMDLNSATLQPEKDIFFGYSCFEYDTPATLHNEHDVFGAKLSQKQSPEGYVFPNGGTPTVWIPELQSFLGIGHNYRGFGDSVQNLLVFHHAAGRYGHHYTQMLYAISKEPPFHLTHLSPEFCFPSDVDSNDCESVQFATGLVRDGDKLHISYGVKDLYGYVATINVSTALERLRKLGPY